MVAEHPVEGVPEKQLVLVDSSLHAMVAMAANYRAQFSPVVVGVTGSVGKTTTKEFCYAVFSKLNKPQKTEGNQNIVTAIPITLFRLEDSTRYAVVEMGMSALGEISRLTRAARPSVGIITCIGVSHLEHLGSRENILKAKLELCEGMEPGSPLVLNADDEYLSKAQLPAHVRPVWVGIENKKADIRAEDIRTSARGTSFVIHHQQHKLQAFIPTLGRHNVYNALLAYGAATALGLSPARAAAALERYESTGMRQRLVQAGEVTVMEDCYNASPDSMRAAFADMAELPAARRCALLGDMLELGQVSEDAHRQAGQLAAKAGVELLVCYGPQSALTAEEARKEGVGQVFHCDTPAQAAEVLQQQLRAGDLLLAKASRSMKLEEILQQYYQIVGKKDR